MSAAAMPPPAQAFTAPPGGGPPRWLAAVLGVLSILVGLASLVWPGPTLLAIGFLFGIYLAVWGIGLLVQGVGGHDVSVGLRILDILLGVFAVLAGLALMVRPGASVLTVAWILGFWFVLEGVMQLVRGFVMPIGRWWNLIWGIVGIVAGFIILDSPEIGIATLVVIVGIGLIIQGVLELMIAFGGRPRTRAVA
jgi:uncharacterized membrane protein HdeD (DUF308 family)